ncbi:SIMPL domain-containing protein [Pontibacter sp. Tf4]|uniref:SIMPL domain-containing protein n=1 Tax=Pontibacter sp. Tf4 TaxID=2761620 RepID=UPI00162521B4|nr:SIMPL domain-containing protein [Pontibacter sp. Tf4]MBB6611744.1 SIMPL domain-containing protein [Pontibacter sp. Tf4]
MKKMHLWLLVLAGSATLLAGCQQRDMDDDDERYLEVIGEYEQVTPDAGYKLNLSYNGPMELRQKFQKWVDSLQQELPTMVKTNDNIYLNYMPEQMGKRVTPNMYQVGVTYMVNVADSATYQRIADQLLKRNIPFSLNMMGTFIDPAKKAEIQQQMLGKAIENAKTKLNFLKGDGSQSYEIISIEELDNVAPYGPEYYEYNRRMLSRVKVRARLND